MRFDPPRILPAGDSALLIEFGDEIDLAINARVHTLARALGGFGTPGLGEAVPAYRSLLLHYDAARLAYAEVVGLVREVLARDQAAGPAASRLVEVPVAYGGEFGPDLATVAEYHGLRPEEIVRRHAAGHYPVYMLGFSPGFAYLGGLDPDLATPRLSTPRTEVPAGSVGIAGAQTGIYPIATPGGWQIIGRTPLRLFDPQREPAALLRPGDRVCFLPIAADRFATIWAQEWGDDGQSLPDEPRPPGPGLEVIEPGLLSTVQDLGRRGYEGVGVPVAGAMDPFALRAANHLVGNRPDAAGLEVTIAGPVLRATADCLIAVGGADLGLRVNDQPLPPWMSIYVRQGWQIAFGARQSGCRAYLAVAGGIAVPEVLGSRSTYLRGGFGGLAGRALQAGDLLPLAPVAGNGHLPARAGRRLPDDLLPAYGNAVRVDVIPGPQAEAFGQEGLRAFLGGEYRVRPTADRMGYRLQGPAVAHRVAADVVSDGIVLGAVQVPADCQPIVMMADRQTMGGYAKIGVVATADIPLLAQCLPGQGRIRFRETSVEAAQRRYRASMAGVGPKK